jgi:hypothetical protein
VNVLYSVVVYQNCVSGRNDVGHREKVLAGG